MTAKDIIRDIFAPTPLNRLFVYGIFLDKSARDSMGMSNAYYTTVRDYVTVGGGIVTAYRHEGFCLSGLIVDVDPSFWQQIDMLESGYERKKIITTDGEEAWMYVGTI